MIQLFWPFHYMYSILMCVLLIYDYHFLLYLISKAGVTFCPLGIGAGPLLALLLHFIAPPKARLVQAELAKATVLPQAPLALATRLGLVLFACSTNHLIGKGTIQVGKLEAQSQ